MYIGMSKFLVKICLLIGVMSLLVEMNPVSPAVSTDKGTERTSNKDLLFVDKIKNNLRRNNDDYVAADLGGAKLNHGGDTRRLFNDTDDMATISDFTTAYQQSGSMEVTPIPQQSIEFELTGGPQQGGMDTTAEPEQTLDNDTDTGNSVFRSFSLEPIGANDKGVGYPTLRNGKSQQFVRAEKSAAQKAPINIENSRVENWKRVLDKSKRLRMYTSTPKIEASSMPVPHTRKVSGQSRSPKDVAHGRMNYYPKKATPAARERPMHAVLKLRTVAKGRAPPNADQLDMAPARGAYIHDLRVKGLFCHRNVLWPEGPKYDSRGNTVMPPFNPKQYKHMGKSFVDTTTALFVLPRCCNCCRKSVLGCQ